MEKNPYAAAVEFLNQTVQETSDYDYNWIFHGLPDYDGEKVYSTEVILEYMENLKKEKGEAYVNRGLADWLEGKSKHNTMTSKQTEKFK